MEAVVGNDDSRRLDLEKKVGIGRAAAIVLAEKSDRPGAITAVVTAVVDVALAGRRRGNLRSRLVSQCE
jgi:hypothetical protein